MQSTSKMRTAFKTVLFTMTSLAVCQFPIVDCALQWYETFHLDHDAHYLLNGVCGGFQYTFTDPDPDGDYYSIPNYVPSEHSDKVDAWVRSESVAGRYIPIDPSSARGTAALGCVDKNHSNFKNIRVVHNMSRPENTSTNNGTDIPHSSLPTVGDAFAILEPGWYQARLI